MKIPEEIPKNHPFSVPDGYFEKLPGIIQSRVAETTEEKKPRFYVRYALQYAIPVVALTIVALLYLVPKAPDSVDTLLASVSTEQLAAYLEESDMTTDELLEGLELDDESAEAIESEVYFNFDDIDLEDLNELI